MAAAQGSDREGRVKPAYAGGATLVTGGDGILASALRAHFPDAWYFGRRELDVTDPFNVWHTVTSLDPDIIIHLGAATRHNASATDLIRTNILAVQTLARLCEVKDIYLVYASTDYVYPGETGNYSETAVCKPVNAYAWSKYAGEKAVRGVPDHLIIRGSWYADGYHPGIVATDSFTSKIDVRTAAHMVAELIRVYAKGTVNIGGPRRSVSQIFPGGLHLCRDEVRAVRRLDYQLPEDVSLDISRYRELTGQTHRSAA